MLGLFIGTLCLVALIATLRARRYADYWPVYGAGCAVGGYGGRARRGGYGRHRRGALYRLLQRLETTPGQEKAIMALLRDLRGRLRAARGEVRDARKQLALAVAGDVLDESGLSAAVQRHNQLFANATQELSAALRRVHDALDARQRRELSEWIADGSLPMLLAAGDGVAAGGCEVEP